MYTNLCGLLLSHREMAWRKEMTKQEEIREGIANLIPTDCDGCSYDCVEDGGILCSGQKGVANLILNYLNSQGVVIRTDAEYKYASNGTWWNTESLIDEDKG